MNLQFRRFLQTKYRNADDGAGGGGGATDPGKGGEPNALTFDQVQKFIDENEDAKSWLQNQKNDYFANSLKTWKDENLNTLIQDEINKKYPPETEEQKKIRDLEDKFAKSEREKVREALVNKAIKTSTEKELPIELVDFFVGETEEVTLANLSKLEQAFTKAVNAKVEERFKSGGREPKRTSGDKGDSTEGMAMNLIKSMGQLPNLEEARKNYF